MIMSLYWKFRARRLCSGTVVYFTLSDLTYLSNLSPEVEKRAVSYSAHRHKCVYFLSNNSLNRQNSVTRTRVYYVCSESSFIPCVLSISPMSSYNNFKTSHSASAMQWVVLIATYQFLTLATKIIKLILKYQDYSRQASVRGLVYNSGNSPKSEKLNYWKYWDFPIQ